MMSGKRIRLLLVHILESMVLGISAGAIVLFLQRPLARLFRPLVDWFSFLGEIGCALLVIFVFVAIGLAWSRQLRSAFNSIKVFPWHFGILVEVLIGLGTYWLLFMLATNGFSKINLSSHSSVFLLFILCVLGLCAGLVAAGLKTWTGKSRNAARRQRDKGHLSVDLSGSDLEAWFGDDRPIDDESENLIPSHHDVARRILERLLSESVPESKLLLNMALAGSYGSGKTSICNLVKSLYKNEYKKKPHLPRMVFTRFEAWQYLSPEAAVRGLVETASRAILDIVDAPSLWRLPERYVRAIEGGGNAVASTLATLLGGTLNPTEILTEIGNILVRLDYRIVIFVDDFDRIEEDSRAAQQAIAHALNQLQSVPQVQYVIAVGPISETDSVAHRPSTDLLKLTRFQERVPQMKPEVILALVRELREQALSGSSFEFPWNVTPQGQDDPLKWNESGRYMGMRDFAVILVELLDTPRALKSALRETLAAWEGGLKGEINWYDLLLMNSLKFAEPALFEWIYRDSAVFLETPSRLLDIGDAGRKRREERAERLKERLGNSIKSTSAERREIVTAAVGWLFPKFADGSESQWGAEPSSISQKLCLGFDLGLGFGYDYMERYFAGRVPKNKIPDQLTLRYIRRIIDDEFDSAEFQSLYLLSREKLTGVLNKFVQFSDLLPANIAFAVCDSILAWIGDPGHAKVWSPPERFIHDMMADIHKIISSFDANQTESVRTNIEDFRERAQNRTEKVAEWTREKVEEYAGTAPLMPIELIYWLAPDSGFSLPPDIVKELCQKLAECLRKEFVEGDRPILPALHGHRFSIFRFNGALQKHEKYEDFKSAYTEKLIDQADEDETGELKARVVISLVNVQHPAFDKEIDPETCEFKVDNEANERLYDMEVLLPALKQWYGSELPDGVAAKAFEHVARIYGF